MSRRLMAAAAATALLTPLAAGLSGPAAGAQEPTATSASPLRLLAPTTSRAESYGGRVYLDSVATLKAQNGAFEIRAHRTQWWKPITGEWKRPGGDVPLPEGSITSWSQGLDGFAKIVIRRLDGTLVKQISFPGCLAGDSQRLSPEAAPRSEYPRACPYNPYTLGSVMGIQDGWGLSLTPNRALPMAPGQYDVTVAIKPAWREFFGISGTDARATTRVTVVQGSEEERRVRPRATSRALVPAAEEPATAAAGETGPRPDLQSLPAWGIDLSGDKKWLRFSANVWNAGDSPLVLDGYREPDEDHMTAYQYFFDQAGNQVGYQQVGELHFHAANHNHWHFEDFARYRLLDEDKNPVRRSRKQSFCLAATDAIDYTVPGAQWNPWNTDLSTACGGPSALAIREVLTSGSGDTYTQYRAGQAINVDGLPNGVYFLAVEANPFGTLVETDTANNVALRRIKITGTGAERRVVVPQLGLVDDSEYSYW